jgi:hypothetical protein
MQPVVVDSTHEPHGVHPGAAPVNNRKQLSSSRRREQGLAEDGDNTRRSLVDIEG